MTPEVKERIYDAILPGWRESRLVSGNRELHAPYRRDEHPSLHVHPEKLTWIDRGTQQGGGAADLARLFLGEDRARDLMRHIGDGRNGTAVSRPHDQAKPKPPPAVEVIGPATSAQIAALKRARRLRDEKTLETLG